MGRTIYTGAATYEVVDEGRGIVREADFGTSVLTEMMHTLPFAFNLVDGLVMKLGQWAYNVRFTLATEKELKKLEKIDEKFLTTSEEGTISQIAGRLKFHFFCDLLFFQMVYYTFKRLFGLIIGLFKKNKTELEPKNYSREEVLGGEKIAPPSKEEIAFLEGEHNDKEKMEVLLPAVSRWIEVAEKKQEIDDAVTEQENALATVKHGSAFGMFFRSLPLGVFGFAIWGLVTDPSNPNPTQLAIILVLWYAAVTALFTVCGRKKVKVCNYKISEEKRKEEVLMDAAGEEIKEWLKLLDNLFGEKNARIDIFAEVYDYMEEGRVQSIREGIALYRKKHEADE